MAVRELGVVIGVALLSSVFAANGDIGPPARFIAGVVPALWLAAALVAAALLAALAVPRLRRPTGVPKRPTLAEPGLAPAAGELSDVPVS